MRGGTSMDSEGLKALALEIVQNPLFQFLGLGGLLLALVTFSFQLLRYGPAIKRLNKLEVLSQLYHLGETQKEMTRAFGEATAASVATRRATDELRKDLDSLREFITDMQEKMSEYNADKITQARLELDQAEMPTGTFFKRMPPAIPTPPRSQDQLFDSIRLHWGRFTDAFRARLEEAGVQPQMNRIGKMTYALTDKRRKYPLPIETADLITALHSQYRRHIALRAISQSEHDNFVQLVKTAIAELQRKAPRAEAPPLVTSNVNANGNGEFYSGDRPLM